MTRKFEIIDLGISHPDTFQGFGTTFTPYDHCVVGIGDNAASAYRDALESIYQIESNADRLALPKRPRGIRQRDRVPARAEDSYYHIGIRWNS